MQGLLSRLKRLEKWAKAFAHNQQPWPELDRLRLDPLRALTAAGITPDPWQAELLENELSRVLLLCSRQAGKSTVAAALAVQTALLKPGSPILILSPTIRQSGELFRKIAELYQALGKPVPIRYESALRMELANGSRMLSLPGKEATVRCFSGVSMLIIDEAARVADALYYSVRPMLAVSKGRLIALSTPFGQRGWFYQEWEKGDEWKRVRIKATECPRIPKEFLESERMALGERWYSQEYLTSFEDTIDAVFSAEDIRAALSEDVKPLFGGN